MVTDEQVIARTVLFEPVEIRNNGRSVLIENGDQMLTSPLSRLLGWLVLRVSLKEEVRFGKAGT